MVRNAAFFTPFRGWRHLDGVPYSERPPRISGVKSEGTLVMENVICKGLYCCVEKTSGADHVTIADSLFVDNYEAVKLDDQAVGGASLITRSVFFSNVRGAYAVCRYCHVDVDQCLFLQNDVGIYYSSYCYYFQVTRTTLAQNEQAVHRGRDVSYNDMLFYKNDVAFEYTGSALDNTTFLENSIGMKIRERDVALNRINFLGVGNEYHIHYTGTSLLDFDVSFAFWNATSVNEIEEHIYDARDGSGRGLVQILAAESMPQTPFRHGMYQADSCAGQCGQSWFNTKWSSLISAGTGSFSFFDTDRSLHSGQVLRDALLTGYAAPGGISLSSYMQDLTDLLGAVSNFQTVGTSTRSTTPLPSTSSTTTTTTTLAEHLVVGADIIMTDPVWIAENTTWTSADGIRALAARVEILPGTSLRIEGSGNSLLVLTLDDCGSLWFNVAALLLLSVQ